MKIWNSIWKLWRKGHYKSNDFNKKSKAKEVFNTMEIVKETTIDSIRTRV